MPVRLGQASSPAELVAMSSKTRCLWSPRLLVSPGWAWPSRSGRNGKLAARESAKPMVPQTPYAAEPDLFIAHEGWGVERVSLSIGQQEENMADTTHGDGWVVARDREADDQFDERDHRRSN